MRACLVILSLFVAAPAAADRSADLLAVVEAERAFAARAQVVNPRQAFVEYFAADAIAFTPLPGAAFPGLREGKDWPVNIQWRPAAAAISGAGDMGYTTGPAEYRKTPGDPAHAWGHYTSVWGRQADGQFKVLIDVGVGHPQPAAPIPDWRPTRPAPPAAPVLPAAEQAERADELRQTDARLGAHRAQDRRTAFGAVLAGDARLHRPGSVPVRGRDAVLAALVALDGEFGWREADGVRVAASGDFGFTYGRGEFGARRSAPEQGVLTYLNIWQHRAGRWQLLVHLSQPVPPPPTSAGTGN